MTTETAERGSAHDRLLAAANTLFYDEGIQTVGIDKVIERAGVAKASLYNAFGSKSELVRAYLELRHERMMARVTRFVDAAGSPRDKLLAVFDAQAELFAEPTFKGCAFVRASAETTPGSEVQQASDRNRDWLRGLLRDLASEAGAADADTLAHQLHILYDGAQLSALMDRDAGSAGTAKAVGAILLDAALPNPRRTRTS